MLMCLHLVDVMGLTRAAVARKFGRSKGSVIGMLDRVRKETNASDNGNKNGTMPQLWWKR